MSTISFFGIAQSTLLPTSVVIIAYIVSGLIALIFFAAAIYLLMSCPNSEKQQTPNIPRVAKRVALLDVDRTLLLQNHNARTVYNEGLIQALKTLGLTKVYLFTSMSLGTVGQKILFKNGILSRPELIKKLRQAGFTVLGVITQADVGYQQGLGKAYETFCAPLYNRLDELDEKTYQDDTMHSENNKNFERYKCEYNKGDMFRYFWENKPMEIESCVFIDDQTLYLNQVQQVCNELQISKGRVKTILCYPEQDLRDSKQAESYYKKHIEENTPDFLPASKLQQPALKLNKKQFEAFSIKADPRWATMVELQEKFIQSLETSYNKIIPNLYLGNRQAAFGAYEDLILKGDKNYVPKNRMKFDAVVSVLCETIKINEYHNQAINKKPNANMPKKLYSVLSDDKRKDEFHYFELGDVKITGPSQKELFFKKLDKAVDFIEKRIKKSKKVLVHCNAGASRSPSLIVAYLMKYHSLTLQAAFNHTKHKRLCIQIENFENLLKAYPTWLQAKQQSHCDVGNTSVNQ